MLGVALWSRVIRGQKTFHAETIIKLSQVSRSRKNVVVGIEGIATQSVTEPQFVPGFRHQLHESYSALWRDRARIETAFVAHHSPYPMFGNPEAMCRFGYKFRICK